MTNERRSKIESIFRMHGPVIKTCRLREYQVSSRDIRELQDADYLVMHRKGFYSLVNGNDQQSDVELASSVVPNGILCLVSAASFYDLTTIIPTCVHLAVSSSTVKPQLPAYPPIIIHVFSSRFHSLGDTVQMLGVGSIRIYDRERTICDIFRLRSKLGLDFALEVLRNYITGRHKNIHKLFEYASFLKIKTIIKPYVEAMV